MYLVVKVSQGIKLPHTWFNTYSEAVNYCEYMDYEYYDENGFCWELGIALSYEDIWEMIE